MELRQEFASICRERAYPEDDADEVHEEEDSKTEGNGGEPFLDADAGGSQDEGDEGEDLVGAVVGEHLGRNPHPEEGAAPHEEELADVENDVPCRKKKHRKKD